VWACPTTSQMFGVLPPKVAKQTFAIFGHEALDRGGVVEKW
jgi:hypothetical protein